MVLNSVVSALPQGERGDISRYTLTPVLTAKIDLKLFIHMLYDPPSIPQKLKSIYSFPPHMFVPPPPKSTFLIAIDKSPSVKGDCVPENIWEVSRE